jgi:hypothetical protein
MKIIFCEDPISENNPDSMYIDEVAAATHVGLEFELIDYKALVEHNNAARAVRDIAARDEIEAAVYRGWMISAKQYAALYDALMSRGIQLLNDSVQYTHTHHLPKSLPIIKAQTPRTVWMETDGKHLSYDAIMELLLPFAGRPLILKDFVKSEKHYWFEACYISSASDISAVETVVKRFLELRGDSLEGGLVFREFVDFMPLIEHPRSQIPLVKEYRIFFLNAQPIATVRYWDVEGYDESDEPGSELFADVAQQIGSRFFTMDVAQRSDGEWMIVELGDGQVATLPTDIDLDDFYQMLARAQ